MNTLRLGVAMRACSLLASPARQAHASDDEIIDEVIVEDDAPRSHEARSGASSPAAPSTLRLAATHRSTAFFGETPPGLPHARFEHRTFVVLGARSDAGEKDPWRLDVRVDLVQRAGPSFGEAMSTDLEARPWELWWRTKTSTATTLTLGYQTISWGVLDVGAAADVFTSYDLRLGPPLSPSELRMPLPAARIVWSPTSRLDLEFVALPFFTPHRLDVAGTRYAAVARTTLGPLANAFDTGTLARISDPLARANGVDANPLDGELGARATLHTSHADFALTAALARSRLPTFRASEALVAALTTGSAAAALRLQQELDAGQLPIRAVHDRYVQLALDAQGSVGRFPWGLEVGVSSKRDLLPSQNLASTPPPRAHVAQAGLRVSMNEGGFALSTQATAYGLLDTSSEDATVSASPVIVGNAKTLAVAVLAARYEVDRWTLEASAIGLCAAPLQSSRACASESLLATGRVGYGTDELTASLFGTALLKSADAAFPIASAIDQAGIRLDWVPARR